MAVVRSDIAYSEPGRFEGVVSLLELLDANHGSSSKRSRPERSELVAVSLLADPVLACLDQLVGADPEVRPRVQPATLHSLMPVPIGDPDRGDPPRQLFQREIARGR
jgi:hypothetical protein